MQLRLCCIGAWLRRLATWPYHQPPLENRRVSPYSNPKYIATRRARNLAEKLLGELGKHYETLLWKIIRDYPRNEQFEELIIVIDRRLELTNDWSRPFQDLDAIELATFLELVQSWERENRYPPLSNSLLKQDLTQINCDIWLLQSALKIYIARLEGCAIV